MQWPKESRLVALDHSPGMIFGVWPGNPSIHAAAVCGNWLSMPLANGTFDTVIGDGSFALFEYPRQWRDAIERVTEVAANPARLILRVFVRPDSPEPVESVVADLHAGRIGSFHVFKWRLAMALQESPNAGVRVGRIYDAWERLGLSAASLSRERGWRQEIIETINVYRGAPARYTFPTLDEARRLFDERWRESEVVAGDYELGERCPILAFDAVSN